MNTTPAKMQHEPPATLAAEILYEDFATGLRAHLLLDRVRQCLGPDSEGQEYLWRFDLLCRPVLLQLAVMDALASEIIVVSAHGEGAMPQPLESWTAEFLLRKGEANPAVILLLDTDFQHRAAGPSWLDDFLRLVGRSSVNVFPCFYQPRRVSELA